MNEDKTNEEKIILARSENIKLHLVLKNNSWRNGFVTEVMQEFFVFEDMVNGKEPIFFIELKSVKPYMEEGK